MCPFLAIFSAGEDQYTTTFFRTPKMSTYLVAFVVFDFASLSDSSSRIPQRVFAPPENIQDCELALEAGVKTLIALENYLDVDFPWPKIDQVGLKQFSTGAMENWGLVTYLERHFYYNNDTSTSITKQRVVTTVAHEYAHQWFGNLVTPKWWSYVWLNEGFATLYAYEAADMAYPEMRIADQFILDNVQLAFSIDSDENTRPMSHYVESPEGVRDLFDDLLYTKCKLIRIYVGQTKF